MIKIQFLKFLRFLDCIISDDKHMLKRFNKAKIYRSKYINKLINYIRVKTTIFIGIYLIFYIFHCEKFGIYLSN